MNRLAWLALLLLCGCGRSPEVKYYVMPTLNAGGTSDGPPVIVGPIQIPRLLDRPQLVWRTGPTRIHSEDNHRWGSSLQAEIQRALAENLRELLPSQRVSGYPAEDPGGEAYRVSVDVEQLDADPGAGITLRARWIVRRGASPTPLTVENALVKAPLERDGAGDVVAAYGAVMEQLSRQVAERVRALAAAGGSAANDGTD